MPKYDYHPYCAAFPDIEGKEFENLRADIRANGQLEPCIVYRKQLVDGKNRERACEAEGKSVNYVQFIPVGFGEERIDEEIRALVISKNLSRRHLTVSQRAMIAARLANAKEGGDRDKSDSANLRSRNETTTAAAAEQLSVSTRSVEEARTVVNNATPEVQHAVDAGEVTVHDAASVAKLPAQEQKAAVKKVKAGKAKTLTAAAKKSPKKKAKREPGEDPTEPGHELPVDSAGLPIPDHLTAVFATHDLFYSADKALSVVVANMLKANKSLPTGAKVDGKKLDSLHKSLFDLMQAAWFKKLCPKCKGARCGSCRQRGYVTKG